MYRLIIVDDERRTRMGLRNIIDWADMGFNICGDFSEGKDALEYLSKNSVDVVLTDIKMSIFSGINLAKEIKRKYPHIFVIFLSGYKNFDYAREAVKLNVKHYLLKPVKIDEIEEVFRSLKSDLDSLNNDKSQQYSNDKLDNLLPFLRAQFFRDLVNGANRLDEKTEQIAKDIFPDFSLDRYCICILDILNDGKWLYEKDLIFNAVSNVFRTMLKGNSMVYIVTYTENTYVAIVDMEKTDGSIKTFVESYIYGIAAFFDSELGLDVRIGVSDIKSGYEDMCVAFIEARTAMRVQNKHYEKVCPYKQDIVGNEIKISDIIDTDSVVQYICEGNVNGVINMLENALLIFSNNCNDLIKIKNLSIQLLSNIVTRLSDVSSEDITIDFINYNDLFNAGNTNQLIVQIKSMFVPIIEKISHNKQNTENLKFDKIIEYIKNNFANDEISLDFIAKKMFVSPSYFSRLFKNKTGENFSDYLISLRLDKARKLLNQGINVGEVSSIIGYKSSKYFSRIFKRYMGITPSEFKTEGKGT